MATAPSASYPGNALLCHCVGRDSGGEGEGEGDREKYHPRTFASPSVEKSDETVALTSPSRFLAPMNPYPLDCHSGTNQLGLT